MNKVRLIKIGSIIGIIVVLLSLEFYKNVYAVTPSVFKNYIMETAAGSESLPLNGKTIVLDPGHGGNDDGTTSIVGTPERTLTLETAKVVREKLENAGATVIMTRSDDSFLALEQRSQISNQNQADAFISFHYNWLDDRTVKGLTDFYYQESRDNTLASDILNEVVKTTGLENKGTSFNNLNVLRNNSQPSTLIELGFVSNKQEDSVVESAAYRDQVAQGIYQGLIDYFLNQNNNIGNPGKNVID